WPRRQNRAVRRDAVGRARRVRVDRRDDGLRQVDVLEDPRRPHQARCRHDPDRRHGAERRAAERRHRLSELLAAAVVFGARERPAGRRGGVSRLEQGTTERAGHAAPRGGRSRQGPSAASRTTLWRHAPTRRHCPRVRDRTGDPVSRRALRRARCADARVAAAGAGAAHVLRAQAGDDGDDYQQRGGSAAALGSHRADDEGTAGARASGESGSAASAGGQRHHARRPRRARARAHRDLADAGHEARQQAAGRMIAPLEITGLTKVFETPTGPFVAVKDVNAVIRESEFVCILGHSGCGKSTVLSIVAGLADATYGGVVIDGKQVTRPGPERALVFQSPCLLPWLTARENVQLAADRADDGKVRSKKKTKVDAKWYLDLVGVGDDVDRMPGELSLGTQQCVSLARALSVEPRFLLLDEPFSMLDSLTRFELQDTLLQVWERHRRTVVMVTHDIDEALYLADRLILMTDGPAATVGEVMSLPFPRPRERTAVLEHPDYLTCRHHVLDFLDHHAHQSRSAA